MRKTVLSTGIVTLWLLAVLVSGCSGTTGNPSSEVGNPNPNGEVALEPLRNVRLPGGYELRIREGWEAREVGERVEVRDSRSDLLFTASVTDDPASRARLLGCSAQNVSTAWNAYGTIFCRDGGTLIVGKRGPDLFGGAPIVVISLIEEVSTDEFNVASAGGEVSATTTTTTISAATIADDAAAPSSAPGICAFLPPGTAGCTAPSRAEDAESPIGLPNPPPVTPEDREGGLLRRATITLSLSTLAGTGDGDYLCLFFLADDPAGRTIEELRDAGLVKGRTCFQGGELAAVPAHPTKEGVADTEGGTLVSEIRFIRARIHNEGGIPFSVTLQQVEAVSLSGETTLTFDGLPVPIIVLHEDLFTLGLGE